LETPRRREGGPVRGVLVYKLDRLGCTLLAIVDAHDRLREAGVELRSATEAIDTSSPSSRFTFNTLASVAEYEREMIRERTREGLQRAYRNGKHTGRIPYGYAMVAQGNFVVVAEEAQVVRQIIANIAVSGATLYSESKRLNDEGIPSPGYCFRGDAERRGTQSWSPSTVRDIVHPTAYSGVHRVRAAEPGEDSSVSSEWNTWEFCITSTNALTLTVVAVR
jgi:site-specific DNA recombinase